jgi:hypothetical protein
VEIFKDFGSESEAEELEPNGLDDDAVEVVVR